MLERQGVSVKWLGVREKADLSLRPQKPRPSLGMTGGLLVQTVH
jgi:hypothetical protein